MFTVRSDSEAESQENVRLFAPCSVQRTPAAPYASSEAGAGLTIIFASAVMPSTVMVWAKGAASPVQFAIARDTIFASAGAA